MPHSPAHTAFILVPGGFCPGAYFHKVTALLQDSGFQVAQIDLLSVGKRDGPPATLYDDAEHVRSKVLEFGEQGKEVVLVANSYGGMVITEAAKGVSKAERQAESKPSGLIHLVYIGSLLSAVGVSTQELVGGKVPVDLDTDTAEYMEPLDAVTAGGYLCSDMSKEDQLRYGSMQRHHSAAAMKTRLTHAGWLYVPTTVVIPERDVILSVRLQHDNVDAAIAKGEGKIRKVVLQAQHCAMLDHPKEIVEILLQGPPTS